MESHEYSSRTKNDERRSSKSMTLAGASGNRSKKRTTRACDRCKVKKMRCTGKQPCPHCVAVKADCEFTAKYTRGKAPPVQIASLEEQVQTTPNLGGKAAPSQESEESEKDERERSVSVQVRGERQNLANDRQYNPSRDTLIFQRTRDNLNQVTSHQSRCSIFEYGDPPPQEVDTSFFVLPSPELAKDYVDAFFDALAQMSRVLHRGTLELWLRELLKPPKSMREGERSRRAVVLMVFALVSESREAITIDEDDGSSFRYFQAAEQQLKCETGAPRLESVQARILQCSYLLSRSRIHQCWGIFGNVISLVYALSMHRKPKSERSASEDWIVTECTKRAFWAVYTMDKYLSLCLGHPQYFNDDDIDQDLPMLVNDENLSSNSYVLTKHEHKSDMKPSNYHTRLAIIVGSILRDIYGIRSHSLESRLAMTQKHNNSLENWHTELLPIFEVDLTALGGSCVRQGIGLKVSHAHASIILYRPFLLENLSSISNPEHRAKIKEYTEECNKSAIAITLIVELMAMKDESFGGSWFFHYCGYTATVALYVYIIKGQYEPTAKDWMVYLRAAEACQARIKISASKESFSLKCSDVLEELHAEAIAHIASQRNGNGISQPGTLINGDRNPLQQSSMAVQQQNHQFDTASRASFQDPKVWNTMVESNSSYFAGDWEDLNFDQSAPGGGILGSMDWIRMQSPTSVIDRIERWGFLNFAQAW